jgi:hypothetical protein
MQFVSRPCGRSVFENGEIRVSNYDKVKKEFDDLFKKPLPPSKQVDPTRSAQIVVSEYLGVPHEKQVIKDTVPKQPKSLREQLG